MSVGQIVFDQKTWRQLIAVRPMNIGEEN
jgi:hypothetical protein